MPLDSALGGRGKWTSVNSSLAWSKESVPGQPWLLHRETLSRKKKSLFYIFKIYLRISNTSTLYLHHFHSSLSHVFNHKHPLLNWIPLKCMTLASIIIMCVCVWACVPAHACSQGDKKRMSELLDWLYRQLWATQHGCQGLNSDPLDKISKHPLTIEPSLQLPHYTS